MFTSPRVNTSLPLAVVGGIGKIVGLSNIFESSLVYYFVTAAITLAVMAVLSINFRL